MVRMEKQIKEGVPSLPENERVIVGEDIAWLKAAESAVDRVFGRDSSEAVAYRTAMQAEWAGAMGPHAHASNITFQQLWIQQQGALDLPTLSDAQVPWARRQRERRLSRGDRWS